MDRLTITHPTTHLYNRYQGQTQPQRTYLELDPESRALRADWDAEIGNAVPMAVYHRLIRRYYIPCPYLTAEAIGRVMDEVAPLAARVCDGWSSGWDGHNISGGLTEAAGEAEYAIIAILDRACSDSYPQDQIHIWEACDWLADTRADVIEQIRSQGVEAARARIESDAQGEGIILEGLDEYLWGLEADVPCDCGQAGGDAPCEWRGPVAETVLVEWMPLALRASHEAAGNRGRWPGNGAERLRCCRECADRLVEADPEWTEIVGRMGW